MSSIPNSIVLLTECRVTPQDDGPRVFSSRRALILLSFLSLRKTLSQRNLEPFTTTEWEVLFVSNDSVYD